MEYFFQNAPYPTQLEKLVKSCSYLFPIRPERARGASKFVVQPDPTHGRAGLRDRAPIPADRSTPRALRPCEKTSGLKHPRRLAIRQLYDGVRDLLLRVRELRHGIFPVAKTVHNALRNALQPVGGEDVESNRNGHEIGYRYRVGASQFVQSSGFTRPPHMTSRDFVLFMVRLQRHPKGRAMPLGLEAKDRRAIPALCVVTAVSE
jgi:hypothetical protein